MRLKTALIGLMVLVITLGFLAGKDERRIEVIQEPYTMPDKIPGSVWL